MVPIPASALPHYTTSFIGRTTEISEIDLRLHDPQCRLLTLVGAGGSGKTRLAIEAVRHLLNASPDGVYFVALQPIQAADHVLSAVIDALSLQASSDSRQHLLDYLQHKRLLLVIDNFEHVLDGAVLLADILNAAPEIKILTTSRESLKLREEWLYEVNGLDYPARSNHQNAPETYSAVQLFIERARQLHTNGILDQQYADIVQICQLVEGMPLALELASGWTRAFSCKEITQELRHNLEFLTTPLQNVPKRHRSMQAVFQHSWGLLTDHERQVMRRFAVFRGGCTREALEQVAGASLHTLAALVDKSLLRYSPETERYDIQELLRQYIEMQLEQSGEKDAAHDSHANYYAASFYAREPEKDGPLAGAYWDAVGTDLDNIRATWTWGLQQKNYKIIDRLLGTIGSYFFNRSHALEVLTMFTIASNQLADCTDAAEQDILARVLAEKGVWEYSYRRYDLSEKSLQQSMLIAKQQNNLETYYLAMCRLAIMLWQKDAEANKDEVQRLAGECAIFYRQQGNILGLAQAIETLADNAYYATGNVEEGARLYQESSDLYRKIGHAHGAALQLAALGFITLHIGHWNEAEKYGLEGLDLARTSRQLITTMQLVSVLGRVAVAKGDFERGRNLLEEAMALCDTAVRPIAWDIEVRVYDRFTLALLADARSEDVEEMRRLLAEAFALIERGGFPVNVFMIPQLGWVLYSLRQIDNAIECLCTVLHTVPKIQGYGDVLYAVAAFARILAHQGAYTRAAELTGLLFTHPNSPIGFLEKHPKMTQLRIDLEAALGPAAYAAAWERGTQLELNAVVHELLREFDPKTNDLVAQANQQLPNPLTERELEVLRLLAEGLTNPRIAERLFIETGTVKGHVNKILQKLDVEDRHQAVERAHNLRLL